MTFEQDKDGKDNDFGVNRTDTHNRRIGRAITKRQLPAWFNPLNVLIGVSMVILMLSVFGTISDRQNTLLNNELIQKQRIESKIRSDAATEERQFQINQTFQLKNDLKSYVEFLAERQGDLVDEIWNLMNDHSEAVIDSHDDMVKILKQPQSNFSAQAKAIKNIEKVLENQEIILQSLNGTFLPVNNTDREIG